MVLSGILLYGVVMRTTVMGASGRILPVGLSVSISSLDWGQLAPNDNVSHTFQVWHNMSRHAQLEMTTVNWNPANTTFFDVGWNREGFLLEPNIVINATVWLHIDPDIEGIDAFSFDIQLLATETT